MLNECGPTAGPIQFSLEVYAHIASVATSEFHPNGKSTQEQGSPFGVLEYINPITYRSCSQEQAPSPK